MTAFCDDAGFSTFRAVKLCHKRLSPTLEPYLLKEFFSLLVSTKATTILRTKDGVASAEMSSSGVSRSHLRGQAKGRLFVRCCSNLGSTLVRVQYARPCLNSSTHLKVDAAAISAGGRASSFL
uniref:Uncharacterized protein n=1 Tax=Marophrys sp. SRT127 TaxID=2488311 RepID=A0A455RE95_9EUKA|nr:hypothetical protein [Marophrys sp. SRT127]